MSKTVHWPQAHNNVIRTILGKARYGTRVIKDFAAKVVRLLDDAELRQRKAAEAIDYARRWSAPEMVKHLAILYSAVIHGFERAPAQLREAGDTA